MNFASLLHRLSIDSTTEIMDELISIASNGRLQDDDIAKLAILLADSGEKLEFRNPAITADIPSTGGPSSLSTLICPLILRVLGFSVPKLGIVGRPAGGIDTLAAIPGYRINLGKDEIEHYINSAKYCHFDVNSSFTPLDKKFFSYRSKKNATAIPSLVIASILSKKLACSVKHVGLDVRVSKFGNFGSSWIEALNNSKRFIRVSEILGIKAKCFLTDFSHLQQPFIGRGESLFAMSEIFSGRDEGSLNLHYSDCLSMARSIGEYKNELNSSISKGELYNAFSQNLRLQGASESAFDDKVALVKKMHIDLVKSNSSGFLKVDVPALRTIIVQNNQQSDEVSYSDNCGIILLKMENEYIKVGEPIASIRAENINKDQFIKSISSVFSFSSSKQSYKNIEIIENGKV